jgi:hypothetical protein
MRILKLGTEHWQCIVKSIPAAIVSNLYGSPLPNLIPIRKLNSIEIKYAIARGLAHP